MGLYDELSSKKQQPKNTMNIVEVSYIDKYDMRYVKTIWEAISYECKEVQKKINTDTYSFKNALYHVAMFTSGCALWLKDSDNWVKEEILPSVLRDNLKNPFSKVRYLSKGFRHDNFINYLGNFKDKYLFSEKLRNWIYDQLKEVLKKEGFPDDCIFKYEYDLMQYEKSNVWSGKPIDPVYVAKCYAIGIRIKFR